ncbi:hypothetical protein AB1Y20_011759 [Prymnesium parvum]|uniref:Uncharacterized protein n=1 Tax=Prymnesium parvum TaxID=97485 RepID=A0AB34IKW5_PRYPA
MIWLASLAQQVSSQSCGGLDAVSIDFASTTNPAVSMEWTDAFGRTYSGSTIPFGVNDTTGGCFHFEWVCVPGLWFETVHLQHRGHAHSCHSHMQ